MRNLLIVTMLLFIAILPVVGCNGPSPSPSPTPDPNPPLEALNPKYKTGLMQDPRKHYGHPYWRPFHMYSAIKNKTIPDEYDIRKQGCLMPIKDQGSCGSCWAFGSATTAEYNFCFQTQDHSPQNNPWSPQPMVSCDKEFYGCEGGLFTGKWNKQYGFFSSAQWPYTSGGGSTGSCDQQKLKTLPPVAKPEDFVYIGEPGRSPTEDEVRAGIALFGSVAVSFGADGALNNVTSEDVAIRCTNTGTNHEVSAVSYRTSDHTFVEQNSWGSSFGARGFFRIKWGCANFTSDAGYYIFKGTPCNPPKAKLAAEYMVNAGDELTMAVKAEAGVTYSWYQGTKANIIGTGPVITVLPANDSEYGVIAKNNCGELEVRTLVVFKSTVQ